MEALHKASAPSSVAVTQGNNIQLEYYGDGAIVLTEHIEANDWVHVPITVPSRINGKNAKLQRVETYFKHGADKVKRIRVWIDGENMKEDCPTLSDGVISKEYDISPPHSTCSSGVIISFLANIKKADSVILAGATASLSGA